MAGPTHNLFVDDSGTKEYSEDRRYATTGGKTPYFVFGGLLLTPREAGAVAQTMRGLKLSTFGTPNVELRRTGYELSMSEKLATSTSTKSPIASLLALPTRCTS
jgi:hypothetical protein